MRNKLNIDALHKVPQILDRNGSYGRRFGKTTYVLYTILGYVQVLDNEDIIVLIDDFKRSQLFDYFNILKDIFEENDLEPIFDISLRRFRFKNNTNRIKFVTVNSIQKNHPIDFIRGYSSDLYLITDLEEMPPEFYQEEITIRNCEILNKYLRK